jgi:predicted acylesterase/phospholipase RssA
MRPEEKPAIANLSSDAPDLVLGAGGSRAILSATGLILACHLAGRDKWRTISGVSGGSIPALMLAAGVPHKEIVRKVVAIDFVSQFEPRVNLAKLWWALFVKNCLWRRREGRGALSSQKLGNFVEQYAPTWPANFWTLAVAGKKTFLFCADGVYLLKPEGKYERISDKPAPVGVAIRATCAVPGVIDGIEFAGELMLDGALTGERCPTFIAKQYAGAKPGAIIACDVSEEDLTTANREHFFWRALRRVVCGDCCDPEPFEATHADGVLVIEPPPAKIQTLDFRLTPDQKWREIMAGFATAVARFAEKGLLGGAKLSQAQEIAAAYALIEASAVKPGELALRTEELLASHSLY